MVKIQCIRHVTFFLYMLLSCVYKKSAYYIFVQLSLYFSRCTKDSRYPVWVVNKLELEVFFITESRTSPESMRTKHYVVRGKQNCYTRSIIGPFDSTENCVPYVFNQLCQLQDVTLISGELVPSIPKQVISNP